MENVTEGFIPVTGGNVWFQRTGNGPGTPLLVLHGGPGGMSMDVDPLRTLGDERPVFHYDQLGCGKSDHPHNTSLWTVERYVEELEQLIQALELNEFHILGHSWGTMLAAAYVLTRQPPGVKSVIFSSPALSARLWERDQKEYLKDFPKETQDIIAHCEREHLTQSDEYHQAMFEYYQRHICRVVPWPKDVVEVFEGMNQEIYNFMWGPSEFTVTGTLKDFDVTERLHEIKVPSLFLCGQFDEATPKTTAYYASLVAQSEFRVLKNCSHITFVEDPQEFTNVVRDFVNRRSL